MPRKLGRRAWSATAVLITALVGGGATAAATAPVLPDLSAASLASVHANAHTNAALAASISRVLATHQGMKPAASFNN
jgi:hypothetical protein